MTKDILQSYRVFIAVGIIILLLLIPLLAMQFSSEVVWTGSDFFMMGFLLFTLWLSCEFIYAKVRTSGFRWIAFVALAVFFMLIWAELSVGVFETPLAGH